MIKRDHNIIKAYQREINLKTRIISNKRKKKEKHKNSLWKALLSLD